MQNFYRPIFYFVDNGFRNQALHNLSTSLELRQDVGLLVQSAVFQEIYKFKTQHFYDFTIHFWRTQSGAEVDFVLYKNENCIIPIEAKFRTMKRPVLTRAFRSFIEAYQPRYGIFITKDFNAKLMVDHCEVHFISFSRIQKMFDLLQRLVE